MFYIHKEKISIKLQKGIFIKLMELNTLQQKCGPTT